MMKLAVSEWLFVRARTNRILAIRTENGHVMIRLLHVTIKSHAIRLLLQISVAFKNCVT